QTRVANLRDGVFGPREDPGTRRAAIFEDPKSPIRASLLGIEVDDLAARYLVWMGMGGTERAIPAEALQVVRNTTVAGFHRPSAGNLRVPIAGANMLDTAKNLCAAALPSLPDQVLFDLVRGPKYGNQFALITSIGDAELWEEICAFGRKP